MQAIMLAAGMGKRLGEYTRENTKCIVPVNGELGVSDIMSGLSLSDRKNFRNNYLNPAISNDWVSAVFPDKPNHPRQAYRLTERGRKMIGLTGRDSSGRD